MSFQKEIQSTERVTESGASIPTASQTVRALRDASENMTSMKSTKSTKSTISTISMIGTTSTRGAKSLTRLNTAIKRRTKIGGVSINARKKTGAVKRKMRRFPSGRPQRSVAR